MSTEEHEIITLAKDLYQQLGISHPSPDAVSWETVIPQRTMSRSSRQRFTEVSPQACIFETNRIILNKNLKGQLQLTEWKPLLAASIIYYQTLKPRVVLGIILRLSPPLALYALAWILLWLGGITDKYLPGAAFYKGAPILGGAAGFTFIVGLFILTLLLGTLVASPYVKKVRLSADRRAEELVGRDVLRGVLVKIRATLDQGGGKRFTTIPSIAERIANLQA